MRFFILFLMLFTCISPLRAEEVNGDDDDASDPETSLSNAPATAPLPSAAIQKIYLRAGESYPLPGFDASNVRVVPQSVVSVHRAAEGVLLEAHAPGNARLFTNGSDKAQVELIVKTGAPNTSTHRNRSDELGSFAKQIPGLKLSELAGKPVIQGRIYGRAQYQKLLLLLAQKPNAIILATAPNTVKNSLVLQAEQLLAKSGIEGTDVSYAGNRFFLEGEVSTPDKLDRAFELASSVVPNLENHIPVPLQVDPTITIHVFLLELSRNAHWALGLHWPVGVDNAIMATPSQIAFGAAWNAQLEHLAQNGEARVLAEPTLAVKNGSTAELKAGGQIPIHILGKFENKVVWKEYGLKLDVRVVGTAGDRIRTQIETAASQLDETTAVDGVPGIRENTLKTEIDAKENQPILLTGLFQSKQSKDVEKVPLLGDIPLLGELFKSRRFKNNESELLVALLPRFGVTEASLPLRSARGLDFDFKWRPLD